MNYFFIDFENVHTEGISDMRLIHENDCIYIMYTENCKNVTLDIVEQSSVKKANIIAFKVTTGSKNALDFQLSSYLGYIVGKNTQQKVGYYIVSKDTGFDRICEFWNGMGVDVKRITSLSEKEEKIKNQRLKPARQESKSKPQKSESAKQESKSQSQQSIPAKQESKKNQKVESSCKTTMEELLAYLSNEEASVEILKVINECKTKQAICNGIAKLFRDSNKTGAVYKKLLPLLKEKKKK